MNAPHAILEEEVFAVTDKGNLELRGAATRLSKQELGVLVLVDGQATVKQLMARVPLVSRETVMDALGKLLEGDLVRRVNVVVAAVVADTAPDDDLDFTSLLTAAPVPPSEGALAAAGQEAADGEEALKQQGYYVSIARAASAVRTLQPDERLLAIVIEDEPHLGQLLRTYLGFEKIDAVVAANREEIVASFRRARIPDVVLLDVMLPDADGFDVLAGIRRHPTLNKVPVIMLTAKTTRESVLRGLAGGADGYITKPFNVEKLLRAVRTVVGLPQPDSKPASSGDGV